MEGGPYVVAAGGGLRPAVVERALSRRGREEMKSFRGPFEIQDGVRDHKLFKALANQEA